MTSKLYNFLYVLKHKIDIKILNYIFIIYPPLIKESRLVFRINTLIKLSNTTSTLQRAQ